MKPQSDVALGCGGLEPGQHPLSSRGSPGPRPEHLTHPQLLSSQWDSGQGAGFPRGQGRKDLLLGPTSVHMGSQLPPLYPTHDTL